MTLFQQAALHLSTILNDIFCTHSGTEIVPAMLIEEASADTVQQKQLIQNGNHFTLNSIFETEVHQELLDGMEMNKVLDQGEVQVVVISNDDQNLGVEEICLQDDQVNKS